MALVTLVAVVGYLAFVFAPRERSAAIASCRLERESTAESRQAAVGMWVESRLGAAAALAALPAVERLLAGAPGHDARGATSRELTPQLTSVVAAHGVRRAFVVDASLKVVARDEGALPVEPSQLEAVRAALASGQAMADLVRRASGEVDMIVAHPVRRPAPPLASGPIRGAVVVIDDPDRWLYPYLAQRLGETATAESILVRPQGDGVVYLSPLRHHPAAPLVLRHSLAASGVNSAREIGGRDAFAAHADYRGVPVFAALRSIPATSWVLVAKIDESEALAAFHARSRQLALAALALILTLLGFALVLGRAERASRAAELSRTAARLNERFKIAALSVSDVVYEWDLKDRVEWHDANGLLGWAPGEYSRSAAAHVASIHTEDRERVTAAVERHLEGDAPYDIEYRMQRKDGSYAWWAARGTAVRDANGRPTHWIGAISDISRRKSDEERLLHLNAVLRAIRNVHHIIAREREPRALLQRVCDSLVEARGYHGAWVAVCEGGDAGFLASAGAAAELERLRDSFEAGPPPECARRALDTRTLQSVRRPAECRACALAETDRACLSVPLTPGGRPLGVLTVSVPARFADEAEERELLQKVAEDVSLALSGIEVDSERRQAERAHRQVEAALAASERKYRHFFEQELAGHYVSTRDGRLLTCNNAFARLFGFASAADAVGADVVSLYASRAARDGFLERLRADGRVDRLETEMLRRDGSRVHVIESAVEVGSGPDPAGFEIHGFLIDDTDRRLAREEFLRAQKMEAVGRLAGGVAHDFNNLLGVILGHAELVQRRLGEDHPEAAALAQVGLAAERGARLTRQLLAFSRSQVLQPRLLDLNAVVQNMESMLGRLIGEDIQLVIELADPLGAVRADEGQIEQILMNLAVNARDAMRWGGRLTIATANHDPDPGYLALHPDVDPGRYVSISVSDDGHGMDDATLSHVFEPFFTTKAAGEGTGLGLATVYGVVKQSGGHIDVETAPGSGTTFRINLPRVAGEPRPATPPAPPAVATGGHETLLLVEDDGPLRSVTREILETAGYRVLEAARPDEAVSMSFALPDRIDLLVSDVVMPGRSGPELAAELVVQRSELRVLFTSGYTRDAIRHHGVLETGVRLLQKPFTASELLREVRLALDKPRR